MGKKSSKPPNVAAAADTEGRYSREAARDATYADRPDQVNPFGTVQWDTETVTDPATGEDVTKWTQNQQMSAPLQSLYAHEMANLHREADSARNSSMRAVEDYAEGPDWEQFGQTQDLEYDPTQLRGMAEDDAYQKSATRLDAQYGTMANELEVKLRSQGLRPGDQAYDAQMASFGTDRNDAYEQARLGATAEGRSEAGQLWDQQLAGTDYANALRDTNITEYLAKRGFNLEESRKLSPVPGVSTLAGIVSGGQADTGE